MIELDARGLKCPLPVLRARKALGALSPGEHLLVLVTDQSAPKDFELFCSEAGHRLISQSVSANETKIVICRGSSQSQATPTKI